MNFRTPMFFIILIVSLLPTYSAAETLSFSRTPGFFPDIAEAVLREAYRSNGQDITAKILPGERALASSNTGQVDGEMMRVEGIDKQYQNLLRVPVAINYLQATAFVKDATIKVTRWEELQPYTIAIERGIKFAEQGTRGMRVVSLTTYEQAFQMLNSGRVDVVIATRIGGADAVRDMGLSGISVLTPPLQKIPLYHYLHKSHASLIPSITSTLTIMEREGRIDAIREQVIADRLTH